MHAPQPSPATAPEDTQAIRATVLAFEEAWNRHDMQFFDGHCTDEVEWVNIVGMWWRGKAAVQKAHAAYHDTFFRNTPLHSEEIVIRMIRPDIAIATCTYHIGPFTEPGGRLMGNNKDRMIFVLVKHDARWLITSAHNTVIDQEAARFDPVNPA